MGQILFFDYCALPIYLIIIYTIFVRKTTKGISNVLFIFLTAFLTFTTICDILAESYGGFLPMSERERTFFSITQFFYLLFRNLSGTIYVLFIITYTRTHYRFRDRRYRMILKWNALSTGPCAIPTPACACSAACWGGEAETGGAVPDPAGSPTG